ncbi:MAG: hypothetical protein J6P46_09285, partial [Bacteroidales bacterium]|nr:hypothetical protein [Bacteroidales bacterium]
GLAVDAAATLLPFVPGGAGTAIKGVRAADKTVEAVSDGFKAVDEAGDLKKSVEKAESITEGSSRAARRSVMRKEGLPTSQQPKVK